MKTFSAFAALVLCVAVSATSQTTQYVTLTGGNYLIQTNQLVTLVGYDWGAGLNRPTIYGNLSNGQLIDLSPGISKNSSAGSGATANSQIPQMATGLTNIFVSNNNGGIPAWATFQITTPTTATVVSNYIPADAIVIPASATGNVQIILESSPDLVNWTAANPGTYGASAGTNRFFGVRAVVQ